ncbi:MAG: alpha/beta hydrolase [Chlorobi bacterium]|nr:alpha/beta hydrolase [Chlorobiota bacterium]
MNRKTFILWLFSLSLLAQPPYSRYRHPTFSLIDTFKNITYGSAPSWIFPYSPVQLTVDVFMPSASVDTLSNRPLIIFAHPGAFLVGNKTDMYRICDSFARLGYVTATISYRLGYNPLSGCSAERAVYRAIQDIKAAIRFFRFFHTTYGIDTNIIFVGGYSAGGYLALHAAYLDKESERPACSYGGFMSPDLGCLDCSGNNYLATSTIVAALNYWGALGDTLFMETSSDPPVLLMHSVYDPIVPIGYDHPFGVVTLPKTYGSLPISKRAHSLGIPYDLTVSYRQAHMLNGFPSFWADTLLPKTIRFLLEFIKPNTHPVQPQTTVNLCAYDSIVSFQVSGSSGSSFWWTYDTVRTTTVYDQNDSILILKIDSSGWHTISVVEFNQWLCGGDTILFQVYKSPPVSIDSLSPLPDSVFCDSAVFTAQVYGNCHSYIWRWTPPLNLKYRRGDTIYEFMSIDTGQGLITIWGFDSLGCPSDTAQVKIRILPTPQPTLARDKIVLCGDSFALVEVSGAESYHWLMDSSVVCLNASNDSSILEILIPSYDTFNVGVWAQNGNRCVSDTLFALVIRSRLPDAQINYAFDSTVLHLWMENPSEVDSFAWTIDNIFVFPMRDSLMYNPQGNLTDVLLELFSAEGCNNQVSALIPTIALSQDFPSHRRCRATWDSKYWVCLYPSEIYEPSGKLLRTCDAYKPCLLPPSSTPLFIRLSGSKHKMFVISPRY